MKGKRKTTALGYIVLIFVLLIVLYMTILKARDKRNNSLFNSPVTQLIATINWSR